MKKGGGVLSLEQTAKITLQTLARRHASVLSQARSTSATLHAWAMQPRGVNGASASKISLIEPTQASPRCGPKPSRNSRAAGAIVRDAP